jgi:hypothetical protein
VTGDAADFQQRRIAMNQHSSIPQVGAQDPDLRNSPIAFEDDEDTQVLRQQVPGEPVCLFNGHAYVNGTRVVSGSRHLKCVHGIWMETGPT